MDMSTTRAARKHVQRAFEVLCAYFVVFRALAKQWDSETLWEMVTCCVILHNIILEDKGYDAVGAPEFQNMGDPIHLLDQNPPHLKSLLKCINKTNSRAAKERSD